MIRKERRRNFDKTSFHDFEFVPENFISNQRFEYGSVLGVAELIGYQMILFKRNENQDNAVFSIYWEDENPETLGVAQKILSRLNVPVLLCDKLKQLEDFYGKADYIDTIYENMTILYYVNKKHGMMYSFGIHDVLGLIKVELIHDYTILNERINVISQI